MKVLYTIHYIYISARNLVLDCTVLWLLSEAITVIRIYCVAMATYHLHQFSSEEIITEARVLINLHHQTLLVKEPHAQQSPESTEEMKEHHFQLVLHVQPCALCNSYICQLNTCCILL